MIINIPPLTHTPLRQLADFLQKGGRCQSCTIKDFLDSFIMLQDEDKDILSKEEFQEALVQNEIKAQFEMISLLREKS